MITKNKLILLPRWMFYVVILGTLLLVGTRAIQHVMLSGIRASYKSNLQELRELKEGQNGNLKTKAN